MYDFDKIIDRRNTNSLKWEVGENELPMWVADMDFETAPEIKEELKKCVDRGIFGYSIVPEQWYDAVIYWWNKRHNFKMEKEWLQFCSGVVSAVNCVIKRVTNLGDNVLVQTPVYNAFFSCIKNQGRNIVENELTYDGKTYYIDFEDLEKKLSNPLTTMMILCNPQNPSGRIWTKEELSKIGELCNRYNVVVLSDEIHCDIIAPGREYIPFASVSKTNLNNSITCIAPTKAFNLAGLQSACIVVENEVIRQKVNRGINTDEVAEPNSFAITAAMSAFNHGEKWLDELNIYIQNNKQIACQYIEENLPMLHVVYSEATYLLWIDCSKVTDDSVELVEAIKKKTGLYLSDGYEYGENGKAFVRMNVACPQMRLMDGLKRLREGVIDYQQNMK